MKREHINPRKDWQTVIAECGIKHSPDLWNEGAFYSFSPVEIEEIQLATSELHLLALQAADYAITNKLYSELGIPNEWAGLIERSWKRRDPYIIGRLDLAFDGTNPPKLIEYNADNPSMIVETAWVQNRWLEDVLGDKPVDQFSDLHDLLIKKWRETFTHQHIHFSCVLENQQALSDAIYMREVAIAAGCTTTDIAVADLGWDTAKRKFVDVDDKAIQAIYKNYPLDWMLGEKFGAHLSSDPMQLIEPAWKLVLTSKGILKLLWKLFPKHPNLLPAFDNYIQVGSAFAKKPLFGREGLNVTIHEGSSVEQTGGKLESKQFVYQGVAPIPCYDGKYPIVSSFIVGDTPAGIGVREDNQRISSHQAVFVPHSVYA